MKILLIRHGEVAMKWEKRYTSEEYNEACERYDMADIDILPDLKPQDTGDYERIYVSTLKRSVQTRQQMFPYAPEEMVIQTPLLNEVPMKSFDSSAKIRPRWLYDLRGRVQWWIGGGQSESAAETKARADALIDLLEEKNVVGTPGSGFGPSGEGYFRLTAFGSYENTVEAIERIKAL